MGALVRCVGCGGMFPDVVGPTHRYMESSPGCWTAYGGVLAQQYTDASYAAAGQMTVDAYAAQHPGQPSPQSIQSVALHLMSLCLVLEREVGASVATAIIQAMAKSKARFVWLTPPTKMGEITVAEVQTARDGEEHCRLVADWAAAAWEAWSRHHSMIRAWIAGIL